MGIIRFLLAIAVVLSHMGIEGLFTGGGVAVQSFFIISGFFVALIFDTVSGYRDPKKFYLSRILRLFPIYYVVLVVSFVSAMLAEALFMPSSLEGFSGLNFSASILLVLSNIFIIGQDWVMFLGWEGGELKFVKHFSESSPPLYHFLFVPQAWSLGVELSFYLIAPFLMRLRTTTICLLVGFGLIVRVLFYSNGFSDDPWNYRFFGLEVFTFLIGAIAYRVYKLYLEKECWLVTTKLVGLFSVALLAAMAVGLKAMPFPIKITAPLFYAVLFLLLPIIFSYTKNMIYDRKLGDLSYPIYLVHIFFINALSPLFDGSDSQYGLFAYTSLVVALSVGVSIILNKFIQNPVDRFRHKGKGAAVTQ